MKTGDKVYYIDRKKYYGEFVPRFNIHKASIYRIPGNQHWAIDDYTDYDPLYCVLRNSTNSLDKIKEKRMHLIECEFKNLQRAIEDLKTIELQKVIIKKD